MNIKKEHFIDAAEKDAEGNYEYYYEGDYYEIAFTDVVYHARSYIDASTELAISSQTVAGHQTPFKSIPYDNAQFRKCIKHFHDELGFKQFKLLIKKEGVYAPVDLEKFAP